MMSDKSDLLERINIAIHQKWYQKHTEDIDLSRKPSRTNGQQELLEQTIISHTKNAQSIEKLEHSIEALEHQNDQLLHFINFLIENLPDLVINIVHTEWETHPLKHGASSSTQDTHESQRSSPAAECPCPTRREQDVLDLLVKGLCAKEIANRLFISETTVVTHKKNLKEKFCARNTVELISKAQGCLGKAGR